MGQVSWDGPVLTADTTDLDALDAAALIEQVRSALETQAER